MDVLYCDHCGEVVEFNGEAKRAHTHFRFLPFNVNSANEGESAVVCNHCVRKLERQSELVKDEEDSNGRD